MRPGEDLNPQRTNSGRDTLPTTLRPGVAEPQITPSSSFEGEGSSLPVADTDENARIRRIQNQRIIRAFSSNDGPYKSSTVVPEPTPKGVDDTEPQPELTPGIHTQNSDLVIQPQPKNPFRRKLSNSSASEPPIPYPEIGTLSLRTQSVEADPKGKQRELESLNGTGYFRQKESNDPNLPPVSFSNTIPNAPQQTGGGLSQSVRDDEASSEPPGTSPLFVESHTRTFVPEASDQPAPISVSLDPWADKSKDGIRNSQQKLQSEGSAHTGRQPQATKSNTDLLSFDDNATHLSVSSDQSGLYQNHNAVIADGLQQRLEHQPRASQSSVLSSSSVSEAELSKLREQAKETYQIKHFNWLDPKGKGLRRSSMLTQNQNGPCPLLALVNALILSIEESALSKTLRSREQVTLGLIIESLMDELTTDAHGLAKGDLPDVDELTRFLLMLHTGMNANPKLASPIKPISNLMDVRNPVLHIPQGLNDDRRPGSFEETADVRLYSAFSIPLLHGWLPTRSDPAHQAFARSAPTYEDAQTIQFGEEELEAKLSQRGLTASEQQLLQDIVSIRTFFKNYPTQLTPYGLDVISDSLFPGSFAILFRNDHFSTIYKHPESGQLFALVTDAGYSSHDEVIWESLVDVSNKDSDFFSGDFRPVGNVSESALPQHRSDPSTWNAKQGPHTPIQSRLPNQSSHPNLLNQEVTSPTSPLQEQADADYALALQLQDEEEARAQQSQSQNPSHRHRSSNQPPPQPPRPNRGQSTEVRPIIPPRRQNNVAVNRSAQLDNDEEAPPAYEEAAKRPAYQPPVGHPSHEGHMPTGPDLGRAGATQQVSPVDARSQRVSGGYGNAGLGVHGPGRRTYGEGRPPERWGQVRQQGLGTGRSQRDRDKDCIVM